MLVKDAIPNISGGNVAVLYVERWKIQRQCINVSGRVKSYDAIRPPNSREALPRNFSTTRERERDEHWSAGLPDKSPALGESGMERGAMTRGYEEKDPRSYSFLRHSVVPGRYFFAGVSDHNEKASGTKEKSTSTREETLEYSIEEMIYRIAMLLRIHMIHVSRAPIAEQESDISASFLARVVLFMFYSCYRTVSTPFP